MTGKDAIRNTMDVSHQVLTTYIDDLSDAELMTRPAPQANHVAWQLGHAISSENQMIAALGHKMPELPSGFAESYTPETTRSDDPAKFHQKAVYLKLLNEQRAATLAALTATPDADLDQPSPESMREYAPTVGTVLNLVGLHEMMHASQIVPVRRALGKPIRI